MAKFSTLKKLPVQFRKQKIQNQLNRMSEKEQLDYKKNMYASDKKLFKNTK